MEIDFIKLMTTKSSEELHECIANRLKYNPNAVLEAINELKRRGETFSISEIEKIEIDIAKQQEISIKRIEAAKFGFYKWAGNIDFHKWKKNIVYNKYNRLAFIISLIYIIIGTIGIYGMYPDDLFYSDWTFLIFFITFPVSFISFGYRFTVDNQNQLTVFIIQTIILIPTFIVVRLILNAIERRKNRQVNGH